MAYTIVYEPLNSPGYGSSASGAKGRITVNGMSSWVGHPSNQTVGLDAFSKSIRDGLYNSAFGTYTLKTLRDGNNNVGVGYNVLNNVVDESHHIGVGSSIIITGTIQNTVGIGHEVIVLETNTVVYGSVAYPYEKFLVYTPNGVVDLLQGIGISGGPAPVTGPYVTTVNAMSGAITVVPGSGIEVTTGPYGQVTVSLYQAIIAALSGGSSNEIGSTVASVALTWTINKTETSQSIDQGIGSLIIGVRSYNYLTPITTNTTFTLTASDGTSTTTPSTTVAFYNRRWWGTSALTAFTGPDILTLASDEFSSTRVKSWVQNGNSEYLYYCYPAAFGLATFHVNGLLNTAWTLTVVSHTNASGHIENYNVYRSNTTQSGTGIQLAVT
jgi:hypothetical protein